MTPELTGISWDHSRALPPLVATAQRFEELNPGNRIRWEKRSLHEFGHADVKSLAERFDLVVVDHPWMGYAAAHGCLLPLSRHLPGPVMADWRSNSVGGSFPSYVWEGQLWAAPIDAATPAAAARLDTLEALGLRVPGTWQEVLELARRGLVLLPTFPPDLLLHLLMLCASREAGLFVDEESFAPPELALEEMERLRELVALTPDECDRLNPIRTFELLAEGGPDGAAYCPFAYAYSNYSRAGFGRNPVTFHDLPTVDLPGDEGRGPLRSVIGGTGLAVSARCRELDLALRYVEFTASGEVQRTLYTSAGGQPAHLSAWADRGNDAFTGGFFGNVLPAMERAWTRPRYYGYPLFQERAGVPLQAWTRGGGSARECLAAMNELYRRSRDLRHPNAVREIAQ